MLIPFDRYRYLIALQLCCWNFLVSETLYKTFNAFIDILLKTTKLDIQTNFGEVRGDVRRWLMARWKAYGRFSIRFN